MAQVYKQEALTDDERKKGIQFHYASRGEYAGVELYLFSDGRFRFENYTCLYNTFSTGTWTIKNDVFSFSCDIKRNYLPIKVVYRERDSSDNRIKRLAMPKDLNGNELKSVVFINNNNTGCLYGDSYCNNDFSSIDSIKISIDNGFESQWIAIKPGNDIIQIILQSTIDLTNYTDFNAVFRKSRNKLVRL